MAGVEFKAVAGYFFGSPRIGNKDFAERVNFPVYRFEHSTDPITFVPPRQSPWQSIWALTHWRWPTLYTHVGERVKVGGKLHRIAHYEGSITSYIDALAQPELPLV